MTTSSRPHLTRSRIALYVVAAVAVVAAAFVAGYLCAALPVSWPWSLRG